MMYVEIMKNFLLADSSELMAVRLIFASWAQKQVILLCRHDVRRVHEKFSSRRFERGIGYYTHFGLLTQKRLIPTFCISCTSSSWKSFFSPIRASWWLLDSFWHADPKNKWFLICRHDVRPVHEKFSSRRFERGIGCYTHFGLLTQKRLIPTFCISCTSSSWKSFFSPIREGYWLLDSFWPPEPKNVWFLLSRHHVRRVHEKFSSRRFERADGC